jgi:hypothetical protein
MALRDTCAKLGTCEYMSRYAREFHLCHCDHKCTLYGDCCINSNPALFEMTAFIYSDRESPLYCSSVLRWFKVILTVNDV